MGSVGKLIKSKIWPSDNTLLKTVFFIWSQGNNYNYGLNIKRGFSDL